MKLTTSMLFFFLTTSTSICLAATYYISPAGNDGANGTSPATAWATVRHVNDGSIRAGDTILFRADGVWATERVYATSGMSGNPTVYGAYSSGARPRLSRSMILDHKSWVTIRGLELTNETEGISALLVGDGNHNDIYDCYLYIPSTNSLAYSAVHIAGSYNKITNSTIEHLATSTQNDAVAFRAGADYNIFEHNTIRQATHYLLTMIATSAANTTATANHNIIRNNKFSNSYGGLIDIVSSANGNFIEGNTISGGFSNEFNNYSPHSLSLTTSYNIVRKNLILNNTSSAASGLAMVGYQYQSDPPNNAVGNRIYHNIVTGDVRNPIWIDSYPEGSSNQYTSQITGNVFKNNIVYENPTTDGSLQMLFMERPGISGNVFDSNIFYRAGYDLVINKNGTGYAVAGIEQADPQFRHNLQAAPSLDASFHLQPDSPAIDAGAALAIVTCESGTGDTFTVDDASYFFDGYGIPGVAGDTIVVGGASAVVRRIDPATGTITLDRTISWEKGMEVNLPFTGSAPDIGIYESSFSETTPPTVNAFGIPAVHNSLTVPIERFSATDNVGVTGYLVTDTGTTPSADGSGWQVTSPQSYKAAGEGSLTLYAWAKDAASNVSSGVPAVVLIDTEAPTTTAAPAAGTYTQELQVDLTCSDGNGSGCDHTYYTTDGSSPSTGSTVYTGPIPVAATIQLKFFSTDRAGNREEAQTRQYTISTTPPGGSVTVNGNAPYTRTTAVTLTLSCIATLGCDQMQFSANNSAWTSPEAYNSTRNWTLTSGDGEKTVYAKLRDRAGIWSNVLSDSIILDTTSPVTTAAPPGGAYRTSQTVTLTCSDGTGSGCATIYYTTDGTAPTTGSRTYAGPLAVAATTILRFLATDRAGNSETAKTQTYTIDTTAPTGSVTINNGAAYTRSTGVTLTLSCTDNSGSCAQMRVSNDNISWSAPQTYTMTKAWTLSPTNGIKTVYSRFADKAGNWSIPASDSIGLDTISPVTTAYPSGGTYWRNVNVSLSCSDQGSGCSRIYYTTNGTTPTTASPRYTGRLTFTSTTTLKFFAIDVAGNSAAVKSQLYTIRR